MTIFILFNRIFSSCLLQKLLFVDFPLQHHVFPPCSLTAKNFNSVGLSSALVFKSNPKTILTKYWYFMKNIYEPAVSDDENLDHL